MCRHLSVVLYIDDAVTDTYWLKENIMCPNTVYYSHEESLQINDEKTKMMVFARRPKLYECSRNGHKIEQAGAFNHMAVEGHIQNMLPKWNKDLLQPYYFFLHLEGPLYSICFEMISQSL